MSGETLSDADFLRWLAGAYSQWNSARARLRRIADALDATPPAPAGAQRIERECGCTWEAEASGFRVVVRQSPCMTHVVDVANGDAAFDARRPMLHAYLVDTPQESEP